MKVIKGKTDWKTKRNGALVNVARNEVAEAMGWKGGEGAFEVSHGPVEGWSMVTLKRKQTGMWTISVGGQTWVGVYEALRIACRIPDGVGSLVVWIGYTEVL